jgi:hypothetical protein
MRGATSPADRPRWLSLSKPPARTAVEVRAEDALEAPAGNRPATTILERSVARPRRSCQDSADTRATVGTHEPRNAVARNSTAARSWSALQQMIKLAKGADVRRLDSLIAWAVLK